jgi:CheY-like chemotaxis protein
MAKGGREGLDSFQRELAAGQCFDIVLTDLGMPDVNGHAVAQGVKQLCPDQRTRPSTP